MGDGLDELRARVKAHAELYLSDEVDWSWRLAEVQQHLEEEEANWLRNFEEAEKSGEPWRCQAAQQSVPQHPARLQGGHPVMLRRAAALHGAMATGTKGGLPLVQSYHATLT